MAFCQAQQGHSKDQGAKKTEPNRRATIQIPNALRASGRGGTRTLSVVNSGEYLRRYSLFPEYHEDTMGSTRGTDKI